MSTSVMEHQVPLAILEDDEEEDETLTERLIGLTEMFPEGLRKVCGSAIDISIRCTKAGYSLSRNLLWVAVSAATILVLPVVFESERANEQEKQKQQERQILLGPSAAMQGGGGGPMMSPGMVPGMMPPPRT